LFCCSFGGCGGYGGGGNGSISSNNNSRSTTDLSFFLYINLQLRNLELGFFYIFQNIMDNLESKQK